jgi:hypothetical protein
LGTGARDGQSWRRLGRGKREEGRGKREEGRGKREEGREGEQEAEAKKKTTHVLRVTPVEYWKYKNGILEQVIWIHASPVEMAKSSWTSNTSSVLLSQFWAKEPGTPLQTLKNVRLPPEFPNKKISRNSFPKNSLKFSLGARDSVAPTKSLDPRNFPTKKKFPLLISETNS